MKITIVYRYFWPDTPPYAVMLREMSRWLAESGHSVEIITAQPSYKPDARIPRQPWRETIDGVEVRRLPLLPERGPGITRLVNSGLFILLAFAAILSGRRRDLVWTATMPPVVQAAAMRLASRLRGAKFLYQMQDIYPELGLASQTIMPGPIANLMRMIDNATLNASDAVVVLSEDMALALAERKVEPRLLREINNFALASDVASGLPTRPVRGGRPLRFVFAGNIGRFQNLEELVAAFSRISPGEATLEIVGEGRVKAQLIKQVNDQRITHVTFRDHMPVDEVFNHLRTFDVGVISLTPGIFRFAFPSKTLTYLAAGLPLLALIEDDSALARMLREHRVGISVGWDKGVDGLVDGVRQIADGLERGVLASEIPRHLFDAAEARRKWLALMSELDIDLKAKH